MTSQVQTQLHSELLFLLCVGLNREERNPLFSFFKNKTCNNNNNSVVVVVIAVELC